MKRLISLIAFTLFVGTSINAQTLTSITIGTNVTGIAGNNPLFLVDGMGYQSTQVFVWPVGSKHIVQFPFSTDNNGTVLNYQNAESANVHYTFGCWIANSSVTLIPNCSPVQTVSGDPALTSLIATVTPTYRVRVIVPNGGATMLNSNCGGSPGDAPTDGQREGVVFFQGVCYGDSTTDITDPFVAPGTYVLNAIPYPGWVFYSWLVNNSPTYLSSVVISGPSTITAQFAVAKRVNFITNPIGLKILVDGAIISTPPATSQASDGVSCPPDFTRLPPGAPTGFTPLCIGQFDFLPGSVHHIGAQVPQYDAAGTLWSFSGFSNGLGQNAVYTAPTNTSVADTIVANFIPGSRISILSNPGGMKIMVDGRDNWQAYNFVWGQGETHTLTAESPQMDAKGRAWVFVGWSDKGAQTHNITVPAGTDYAITATYAELAQLTIASTPGGLNFTLDGSNCVTPCVSNKTMGSTAQITAPNSIPAGAGSRYDFIGWSDGETSASRTINFTQDTLSLTANYQTSYQFTAVSNPANAGTFKYSPPSSNGFFPSGTVITVTAVANNGFKFAHWEGDTTSTFASATLTMDSPRGAQADFASVPFIPPSGIQSVTGPTPDGSVAPGSIISIYGTNLAPALTVGPTNPLSQTLGGLYVTVGTFLLPLVFVSPDQLAAQVPWELADGQYTLVVHSVALPDVPGTFTVSRNAPGAFTQANDQNLPLVLALHQDGTVVNFASPAKPGEQVTIYGTGFGPYTQPSIDGFPTQASLTASLVDSLSITSGASQLQPDSAGPAAGMVGVATVKLTITNNMAGAPMSLTFVQNGKTSAQVVLPVQ